jgi:hypothetical protein
LSATVIHRAVSQYSGPPVLASPVTWTKTPSRIEISRRGNPLVVGDDHEGKPFGVQAPESQSTSSAAAALSRFPVGLSARTTAGSLTRARAMATRWRCPPESADGRWLARSAARGRPVKAAKQVEEGRLLAQPAGAHQRRVIDATHHSGRHITPRQAGVAFAAEAVRVAASLRTTADGYARRAGANSRAW